MPPHGRGPVFGVRFPTAAWDHDHRAASPEARAEATRWRAHVEANGLAFSELLQATDEHTSGSALAGCVKVRIPASDDSEWGAVLTGARDAAGRPVLVFVAFGVRHPKPPSRQPTVYERAHRRLHSSD